MGVRITGGRLVRRTLAVPKTGVRPTADRAREALFSSMSATLGHVLVDARVLDAFAGSGALGIEALSRGARHATFIERSADVARVLRENLAALDVVASTKVVVDDARRAAPRLEPASFELVFVDPPYADAVDAPFLAALDRAIAPGGVLVVERARGETRPLEIAMPMVFDRRYGEAWVRVFAKPSTTSEPDEITTA